MSRSWAGGSTRQWRRTRQVVLARDHGLCRLQITGVCTVTATCVHHILGRAVTGDDPRYLVAACEACNLAVGEPTPDPEPTPRTEW
jgi:5-methylcytosine-specific restriction endonuclease McrA